MGYRRFRRYPLDEVLPFVGRKPLRLYEGFLVRMNTARMRLLARQQACACCCLQGTHLWLEASGCFRPHFNLYGTAPGGRETMLTLDHVVARCRGGRRSEDNVQLLCSRCNNRKGHLNVSIPELRLLLVRPGPPADRPDPAVRRFVRLRGRAAFGEVCCGRRGTTRVRLWCGCMNPAGHRCEGWTTAHTAPVDGEELDALFAQHVRCPLLPGFGNWREVAHVAAGHLCRPSVSFFVPKIAAED